MRKPVVLAALCLAGAPALAQQPLLTPVQPGQPSQAPASGAQLTPLEARLLGLENRLQRLERVFENQVMNELLQGIDQLQTEVRELRGELESQYNEMNVLQKRQRDLYRDSDRRLRELELGTASSGGAAAGLGADLPEVPRPAAPAAGAAAAAATASAGSTQPPGSAATPANDASEKAAYTAAFEHLKTGRYPQAITAYREFLKKYPDGRYADNAQYWLGEANYVSRAFDVALAEFQKVVDVFPASPKVADARLKIGFVQYELGSYDAARESLSKVIQDYPNSSVARLARQRIVRMKKEGH